MEIIFWIDWIEKGPTPNRHHFGLPSMEETIEGIKEIAEAKVLDIISLGPDQNAQEVFLQAGGNG